MNEDKYYSTVKEFVKPITAQKMIILAFKEIVPTKGNRTAFIVSFILGSLLAVIVGFDENTVTLLLTIMRIISSILLPILGYSFAVYSILLAFMNENYIQKLAEIRPENGVSHLLTTTSYYASVLFLYFTGLGITGVLFLFLSCIRPDYVLTSSLIFNNCLASILLAIYFCFAFRIFYEIKSVIYNTVMLFRNSIAYKLLAIAEKEKKTERKSHLQVLRITRRKRRVINFDNNNK